MKAAMRVARGKAPADGPARGTLGKVAALASAALLALLICASGARSGRAVAMLNKLGYERAYTLAGGLRAWREANMPVEKKSA